MRGSSFLLISLRREVSSTTELVHSLRCYQQQLLGSIKNSDRPSLRLPINPSFLGPLARLPIALTKVIPAFRPGLNPNIQNSDFGPDQLWVSLERLSRRRRLTVTVYVFASFFCFCHQLYCLSSGKCLCCSAHATLMRSLFTSLPATSNFDTRLFLVDFLYIYMYKKSTKNKCVYIYICTATTRLKTEIKLTFLTFVSFGFLCVL